eukprot:XP_012817351.1 PREDICTED: mucin-5B-like [Xenopus tropicalis]
MSSNVAQVHYDTRSISENSALILTVELNTLKQSKVDVTFRPPDIYHYDEHLRMVKPPGTMSNEICSYWNFHYNTFDGDIFYFPGTCNYILSSDCKSTYEDFIIQIQNTLENGTIYTKIIMKIDMLIVVLLNNTVLVNGELTELPHSSSGVMINKIGVYTKVTSKIGLEFNMNDDGSLMLRLDPKYSNETCGLCGDYNGMSKINEFTSSSGIEISETEFGNLQKVNVPNEKCEDVVDPNWESCNETGEICANILNGPSFVDCLLVLPIDDYVYSCMEDLCTCKEDMSSDCICSTIAEYSRQCIRNGGTPGNWRTQELCPKTCPLNLEYNECGPSCRDSCSNPERGSICENRCVEGCFCPSGMVLDDIEYLGCINLTECACTYNGNVFLPGANYSTSCSSCTCSGGKWNCKDTPCSSTCSIEGGSHVTTFDVTHFTVYGDCTYVLSKVCDDENFIVLGELRPCGRKDTETCLMEVIIILNSGQTTIEVRSTGEVYVNFLYTILPISSGPFTMLQPSPFYIVFDYVDGMQAIIQLVPVMQLYVVLDPKYKTKTCGICGNFNDIQGDDFLTISGVIEGSAAAFVNTWKTDANCPSVKTVLEDPCALSLENEDYAKHWCSLLTDSESVFSQCHYVVNPNVFYKNCLSDTCSCENSEECMCAALFSYVRACAAKDVILTDWNSFVCTNYRSVCSNNQVFSYTISSCLPTCGSLSLSDSMCEIYFDPLMGCSCGKGLYLDDDGKCVPPSLCPCYYRGSPIQSGTTINEGGVICTCTQGKLNCTGNEISDCVDPMVYISCKNATPGTPGAECFKSCETLDMHCYSKRCIPGCVCPNGLVFDGKGGCIRDTDCPCIHNEAMYAPGDEIKIRCNTCVCKDRMWNCTENVCLATCKVYGDGHYSTFDGQIYSFGGECEYTLAKDHCSSNDTGSTFRVITENIPCGTTGTTCSKSIKIFLNGYELVLLDDHLNVIQRGNDTKVPYRVRLMGIYMVIETNQGLLLVWDKRTTIYIKVTNIFQGMLCGLCGNYDGNRNNDFTTRTNAVVGNVEEFANSWKLSLACPDAKLNKDPCALNPYRMAWAQKQCSIIYSGVFAACHPHVDPSPYYDACVSDTCACNTGGDCECFCTAVAAYSQACGEFFICIYWRTPTICPMFCDYYNKEKRCEWHYRSCGAPCLKTCRNPSGKCSYELGGLEGCYPKCPKDAPYFDEDDMECVSKCGCLDEDRVYYKLGSQMPSNETCFTCYCTENGPMCSPNAKACVCIYEGRMYNYNQTIYSTTDGMGGCITAICKENGTIHRDVSPCLSTLTPPFTFSTVPTTARTKVTKMTTTLCVFEQCEWSQWFDVSNPATQNGDDDETYQNIRNNGYNICENPKDIHCEADNSSTVPFGLKNNIICNVSIGLFCNNSNQPPDVTCLNYQIQVLCCSFVPCELLTSTESPSTTSYLTSTKVKTTTQTSATSHTTTTHTTKKSTQLSTVHTSTTSISPTASTLTSKSTSHTTKLASTVPSTKIETTKKTSARTPISGTERLPYSSVSYSTSVFCSPGCYWSPWFNLNSPSPGISDGDFENLKSIQSVAQICTNPDDIECRAVMFPNTSLNELGQKVICDVSDGLLCLNKNQTPPMCYDYEIRFHCCDDYSKCITTPQLPTETTHKTTSLSPHVTTTTLTKKSTILSSLSTHRTSISPTASRLTSKSTSHTTKSIGTSPELTHVTKKISTAPTVISTTKLASTVHSTKIETTKKTSARTPISGTERQPYSSVSYSTSVFCSPGCYWSPWFNLNSPSPGISDGDFENLKAIQSVAQICTHPNNIECRAVMFPNISLNELGQNVICDVSDGLQCLNMDQTSQMCYDYEIRFHCCDDYSKCITTPQLPTETTHKTTSLSPHVTTTTLTKKSTILSSLSTHRTSISPTASRLTSKSTSHTTKSIGTSPILTSTTKKISTTKTVVSPVMILFIIRQMHLAAITMATAIEIVPLKEVVDLVYQVLLQHLFIQL